MRFFFDNDSNKQNDNRNGIIMDKMAEAINTNLKVNGPTVPLTIKNITEYVEKFVKDCSPITIRNKVYELANHFPLIASVTGGKLYVTEPVTRKHCNHMQLQRNK